MWVLKLGGSLSGSRCLPDWLEQAARLAARGESLVLVPGGGPFADQVRKAQARWGFDDRTAHRMALLAMEQTAAMLCALHGRLIAVETEKEIHQAGEQRRVAVWRPSRMVLAEPGIPEGWEVSSDSLALWLACRLGARGVLLVKSASLPAGDADLAGLQRDGLLDGAFLHYARQLACPVRLLHRTQSAALAATLMGGPGRGSQSAGSTSA